jgi:5'-nucleotidase
LSTDRLGKIAGFSVLLVVLSCRGPSAGGQDASWPRRVVITNDDGFDSQATLELARAFAQVAETYLIVPAQDQSSTSNFAVSARTRRFEVERRDVGDSVHAWALDGYPADCILFALSGPLRDNRPDLVVSGINTGSNAADSWVHSGTIGAARVATYYGVPSLAVSGIDNDDEEAVAAVVRWVVQFARSEPVQRLRPPQFLAVSVPVGPASQISGVEVSTHARGLRDFRATQMPAQGDSPSRQVWTLEIVRDAFPAPPGTDAVLVGEGKIAIVPMRVDEADPEMGAWLEKNKSLIPAW